jgi:hypothetical protein
MADRCHLPAWPQLVHARHIGLAEVLVSRDVRPAADDVVGVIVPAAVGLGPTVQRPCVDGEPPAPSFVARRVRRMYSLTGAR